MSETMGFISMLGICSFVAEIVMQNIEKQALATGCPSYGHEALARSVLPGLEPKLSSFKGC